MFGKELQQVVLFKAIYKTLLVFDPSTMLSLNNN
jgi:hypothetical protein